MNLPQFSDKREMFAYLVKNKSEIMDMKKSAIKTSDAFGMTAIVPVVVKGVGATSMDTDTMINRDIIGNTYNWLDSHGDVHRNGIFGKSIQDRKNKIWHLHDHEFAITAKVGVPQLISEKYLDWTQLGINKTGQTQALVMNSNIMKQLNPNIFMDYLNGDIDQHSVSMVYVKMALAINDADYPEEYEAYKTLLPNLGNPEKADETGFFWDIQEAKLREISCVLEGSNSLTPVLNSTKSQPPVGTGNEPQKFDVMEAIKSTTFFKN